MPMKDVASCEKPRRAAKQALTRGCPNGETPCKLYCMTSKEEEAQGTETSKYLGKINQLEIPIVAASELGSAQTVVFGLRGCRTPT